MSIPGIRINGVLQLENISNTLFIDGTNGRVGINADPPENALHLAGGGMQFENDRRLTWEENPSGGAIVLYLSTGNVTILRSGSAEVIRFGNSINSKAIEFDFNATATEWGLSAGFINGAEISDPGAPAVSNGRIFFQDNGAGKTQLVVRFATGAVQVIATEP